jgi:hypothetical protein
MVYERENCKDRRRGEWSLPQRWRSDAHGGQLFLPCVLMCSAFLLSSCSRLSRSRSLARKFSILVASALPIFEDECAGVGSSNGFVSRE